MALESRARTRSSAGGGGLYIGRVTRVAGDSCYVVIPRLAPGFEYGPARYPGSPAASKAAGGHAHDDAGNHAHGVDGSHNHLGEVSTDGDHTHPAAGTHAHPAVPDHKHPLEAPLEKGDDVVVGFLEGGTTDLVVLVRLAKA